MLVVWQDKEDGEEDADEEEEYAQGQGEAYDATVHSSTAQQDADAEREEVARAPVRS